MKSNDDLDRRLSAWLEEDAAPRAPRDLEAAFIEGIATARQRPGWATTERWISMETRAQFGAVPRAAIIVATLLLLAALTASAIVAGSNTRVLPPPFGPASNGLIAYAAGGDIWLLSADGQTQTRLTSGPGFERSPVWSLDGTQIAYSSATGETYDLVVANADGSEPRVLVSGLSRDPGLVHWKPDGSAVMYELVDDALITDQCADIYRPHFCGGRIWLASTDGSSIERISPEDQDASRPAWSPDGATIAFTGRVADSGDPVLSRLDEAGLFLMDADGSNVRRLSDLSGSPNDSLYWSAWSPDGTRIATNDAGSVYVVDVESGVATEVASGPRADMVAWSPDGNELAVSQVQVGGTIIADGSERGIDAAPVHGLRWSPDGTMLIGETALPEPAIHLLDLDGELLRTIQTPNKRDGLDFQRLAP